MNEYYQIYTPTLLERFWTWFGYRGAMPPDPTSEAEKLPGWMKTEVYVKAPFWHRILFLISGSMKVETNHYTDQQVDTVKSFSAVSYLSPGNKR